MRFHWTPMIKICLLTIVMLGWSSEAEAGWRSRRNRSRRPVCRVAYRSRCIPVSRICKPVADACASPDVDDVVDPVERDLELGAVPVKPSAPTTVPGQFDLFVRDVGSQQR